MFARTILAGSVFVTSLFVPVLTFSQQKPPVSSVPVVREFPATMGQSVTAGKTPIGTKVSAKLSVAPLVDGVVYPKNATFSGEVTESVAKSSAGPSRLAIVMNSVQWKGGSASIKVFLTGWYYPTRIAVGQNLDYGPADTTVNWKTWNGAGAYPTPNAPGVEPFPGHDSDRSPNAVPNTPVAVTLEHPVMMKHVESAHSVDGSVAITSTHSNIKLDKLTDYVLATGEIVAAK